MDLIVIGLGTALLVAALFLPGKILACLGSAGLFAYYFNVQDNLWLYLIFILGVFLIILELYIPDFGISGILGIVSIILAFYIYIQDLSTLILTLLIIVLVALATFALFSRLGMNLSISPFFVLETSIDKKGGYTSRREVDLKLGDTGRSLTTLRPVGKAQFKERTYEVISSNQMIGADRPILVERIEDDQIYVIEEEV